MDNRAVGVFDSGLGGLTAVRELRRILPHEKIVFLGDTLRVPYGTRDPETLRQFAEDDLNFLLSKNVKYIVRACGTVSSNVPEEVLDAVPVPVTGVIAPTVAAAVSATKNGIIGAIATPACIGSAAYQRGIAKADPSIKVTAQACPKLVPLIESFGVSELGSEIDEALEEYLAPIRDSGADTLILGCTHYPLIADRIRKVMDRDVTLIDSGAQAARTAKEALEASGTLASRTGSPRHSFYVTSDPERFTFSSGYFLGETLGKATLTTL